MNWKAYEEIHFSDDNIQRWVREGDVYVNKMTLEQMSEFETKIRQQQAEIEALKKELETCKTIVALSNIAWKNKFGDDK